MLLRCRNRKEVISQELNEQTGEETIDYKKNTLVNLAPYQITVAASNHIDGIPDSLGIRGQTLKVVPFASSKTADDFDYLEVRRSPAEVIKTIELSLSKLNTIELAEFGQNLSKIFNPEATLLHFPFCIAEDYAGEGYRRYVLDGLTGRILSIFDSEKGVEAVQSESVQASGVFQLSNDLFELFEQADSPVAASDNLADAGLRIDSSDGDDSPQINFGAIQISFHRCGVCGNDLPARPSCIYICRNCHELTCLDKNLSARPKVIAAESPDKNAQYFPFWIFQTTTGRLLGFQSDNASIAIPAFKILNFEALYRLSRRISTACEHIDSGDIEVLDERFLPVDILPTQAITLANVIYYRYSLEKTSQLPKLELQMSIDGLSLNYIPFKPENYFFVDSILKSVTFEKKLVGV
jgi:hypothetical protein